MNADFQVLKRKKLLRDFEIIESPSFNHIRREGDINIKNQVYINELGEESILTDLTEELNLTGDKENDTGLVSSELKLKDIHIDSYKNH